jgi:hypothetical protein
MHACRGRQARPVEEKHEQARQEEQSEDENTATVSVCRLPAIIISSFIVKAQSRVRLLKC